MSRIGRAPVAIPEGVKVEVIGLVIKVSGPKGALEQAYDPALTVAVKDKRVTVARPHDKPAMRAKHGLVRALVNNMVRGVTQGFEKTLEIQGVGYRAAMDGKTLTLSVGYSHPVDIRPIEGVTLEVEGNNRVHVRGIDKQKVGAQAALIRKVRPPNPYKEKGIKYSGELLRFKPGKAAARKA